MTDVSIIPAPYDQLGIEPQDCTAEEFRSELSACRRCKRRKDCYAPVLPDGDSGSPVAFHGRDPGKTEDEFRIPFHPTARGGSHFTRYLEALGLNRSLVYVSNTVFCHGLGDRAPEFDELRACRYHKSRELFLTKSKFVFLLGNDAFRLFFDRAPSVMRAMGKIYQFESTYYIPILHPGHAMRKKALLRETLIYLSQLKPVLRKIYEVEVRPRIKVSE